MHTHLILNDFLGEVTFRPPKKAEETAIGGGHSDLVKHRLQVSDESDGAFPETSENAKQIIHQVRPLEQAVVDANILEASAAIENDPYLTRLMRVIHTVMG
jgi:hypothetical protein